MERLSVLRWDQTQQDAELVAAYLIMAFDGARRYAARARETGLRVLLEIDPTRPFVNELISVRVNSAPSRSREFLEARLVSLENREKTMAKWAQEPGRLPVGAPVSRAVPDAHALSTYEANQLIALPEVQLFRMFEAFYGDSAHYCIQYVDLEFTELAYAARRGVRVDVRREAGATEERARFSAYIETSRDSWTLLSVCTLVFDVNSKCLPRYAKGLLSLCTPSLLRHAALTRNERAPALNTQVVGSDDVIDAASYTVCLLHTAESSSGLAFEQINPPEGDVFHELDPSDGLRRTIVFWRSAAVRVYHRPTSSLLASCVARSFLSKCGKSSFEFTCDLFVPTSASSDASFLPVATIKYTLVVVDRKTSRPTHLFFDGQKALSRYPASMGELSPGLESKVDPKIKALHDGLPSHSVKSVVLHRMCDLNGHLNSGRYMEMVHIARDEALSSGVFSPELSELMRGEDWVSEFVLDYAGEISPGPCEVRISAALLENNEASVKCVVANADHPKGGCTIWLTCGRRYRVNSWTREALRLSPAQEWIQWGVDPAHWGVAYARRAAGL